MIRQKIFETCHSQQCKIHEFFEEQSKYSRPIHNRRIERSKSGTTFAAIWPSSAPPPKKVKRRSVPLPEPDVLHHGRSITLAVEKLLSVQDQPGYRKRKYRDKSGMRLNSNREMLCRVLSRHGCDAFFYHRSFCESREDKKKRWFEKKVTKDKILKLKAIDRVTTMTHNHRVFVSNIYSCWSTERAITPLLYGSYD